MKCRKVASANSRWCANCRCTLGYRYCPEGHQNNLSAKCCSECGSAKLTPGTTSINLRPLTWVIAGLLAYLTFPPAWQWVSQFLASAYKWLLMLILPPLVTLAMIHVLAYPFLTDRGRANLNQLWSSIISLLYRMAQGLVSILLSFLRRK